MKKRLFNITKIKSKDKPLVTSFIAENWGSHKVVTRGKIIDTCFLPGFISKINEKIIGLITYKIENNDCEIVTLDSKTRNQGLGSRLIEKVIEKAKNEGCKRIWLITTNDNLNAIGFYQKRGFEWVEFHKNALDESRKLKPEIPETGFDNIPL